MADNTWYVDDNRLTHIGLPAPIDEQFTPPYAPIWWYIDGNELVTSTLPAPIESPFAPPYPPFWWYVDNGRLVTNNLPTPVLRGAFANCKSLDTAHIPESVKSIGQYAFRSTALESVTIASDCTYSATSFPEDCEIEFYTDPENESEGDSNE